MKIWIHAASFSLKTKTRFSRLLKWNIIEKDSKWDESSSLNDNALKCGCITLIKRREESNDASMEPSKAKSTDWGLKCKQSKWINYHRNTIKLVQMHVKAFWIFLEFGYFWKLIKMSTHAFNWIWRNPQTRIKTLRIAWGNNFCRHNLWVKCF